MLMFRVKAELKIFLSFPRLCYKGFLPPTGQYFLGLSPNIRSKRTKKMMILKGKYSRIQ
jgi:hypothetical protein